MVLPQGVEPAGVVREGPLVRGEQAVDHPGRRTCPPWAWPDTTDRIHCPGNIPSAPAGGRAALRTGCPRQRLAGPELPSHPRLAGKGGGVAHPASGVCPWRRQQSAAAPPARRSPARKRLFSASKQPVRTSWLPGHIAAGICPTQGGHQASTGVAPGSRLPCPRQEDGVGRLGLDGGEQPPLRRLLSIKCAVQVGEQQQAHWGGKLVRMQGVAAQSQSLATGRPSGPRSPASAAPPIIHFFVFPYAINGSRSLYHPPIPWVSAVVWMPSKPFRARMSSTLGAWSDAHLKESGYPPAAGRFSTFGSRPGKIQAVRPAVQGHMGLIVPHGDIQARMSPVGI